jgi:hypothetical protein
MPVFRTLSSLLFLLFAVHVSGVTLTMGNDVPTPNSSDSTVAATRTDIDLVHPASHTGSVSSAKVYWSQAGCTNALKIKFFRRVGDTLTLTAERGPFTSGAGLFTVTLTPAVNVQQGDLIGVARVAACGNAGQLFGITSEGFLEYASDFTGSAAISAAATHQGGVLSLSASGTPTESVAQVIPVVGSTGGALGSQFKTEMQFFNPQTSGSLTCRAVFHPSGVGGSSSDPARVVNLDPGQVFATDDIVALMGVTGLGSLDIVVPAGQSIPIILTRVYNDAGANGTSSLTEVPVPVSDGVAINTYLMGAGVTGFLVGPRDPVRTRFNIGVRTLFSGATIQVTQRNSAGVLVRTASHTYTATFFVQTDAASFLGGPIGANDTIQISVSSGSAIVYGSTTDNTTNDPAIQFAFGVFAIA